MNQFKVISKVGEGAHGVVLKAKYILTGEMVVNKLYSKGSTKENSLWESREWYSKFSCS